MKVSNQTKEIESLKNELARKVKQFESQLKQANAGYEPLQQDKIRLMAEIKKLKDEL